MFTTEFIENTNKNPAALQLILDAHMEMIKTKVIDNDYGQDVKTSDKAFLLYSKNKVVGLITFYVWDIKNLWISLSYVKPKFRKQGGWYELRQSLNIYAIKNNYSNIFSGVFSNNTASLKANSSISKQCCVIFKQKVI